MTSIRRRFFTMLALVALLCVPSLVIRGCLWEEYAGKNFAFNKYRWNHSYLQRKGEQVRLAIIGSSHTWTALDAGRIGEAHYGSPLAAVNLSATRNGRGIDYLTAKYLLSLMPNLETIVLGITTGAPRDVIHTDFHRLASLGDTFADPLFGPDAFCTQAEPRAIATFYARALLESFVGGYRNAVEAIRTEILYRETGKFDLQSGSNLRTDVMEGPPQGGKIAEADPPFRPCERDMIYLERTIELARDHGVEVVLVELPFPNIEPLPKYFEKMMKSFRPAALLRCSRMGELASDPANWADPGHLNETGAKLYTSWFISTMWDRIEGSHALYGKAAHDPLPSP